ncbi:MAG: hypothetical protein P4L42_07240 [Desulfocapsaceae bacterium]|nr:hypothetical protein [Desulfocapsaceae bacterium]
MNSPRVLIVFFSFSSQTRNLLQGLSKGLREYDIQVEWQQLKPLQALQFPPGSYLATVKMMLTTFFRKRLAIEELSPDCFQNWDLIIVAGPTWSYHPSGPILSLLDRDGERLVKDQLVLPFISCRGYWRMHHWGLRRLLRSKGARVLCPVVFAHPVAEPWRTIGVFLKLAGKVPESGKSWFHRFYPKYGHSSLQINDAKAIGLIIGKYMQKGKSLQELSFPAPVPVD